MPYTLLGGSMYNELMDRMYDEIAARYGDMVDEDDADPIWAGVLSGFEMDEELSMRG